MSAAGQFRNDRMRVLYQQAIAHGWIERTNSDSKNHVQLVAPDDPMCVMVMSKTAVAKGRSVLNTEAVFKRWLRQKQEREANGTSSERIIAAINNVETRAEYAERGLPIPVMEPPPDEEALDQQLRYHLGDMHTDPDWRTVEKPLLRHSELHRQGADHEERLARGSQRRAERTERLAQQPPPDEGEPLYEGAEDEEHTTAWDAAQRREQEAHMDTGTGQAPPINQPDPDTRFTLREVMIVAEFGSLPAGPTSGSNAADRTITLSKLEKGLRLIADLKGAE